MPVLIKEAEKYDFLGIYFYTGYYSDEYGLNAEYQLALIKDGSGVHHNVQEKLKDGKIKTGKYGIIYD